jgi:hypothetical protein
MGVFTYETRLVYIVLCNAYCLSVTKDDNNEFFTYLEQYSVTIFDGIIYIC